MSCWRHGGSGSCSSRVHSPSGSFLSARIIFTEYYWFQLQIAGLQGVDGLDDLDIGQKRALICRELECTLGRTQNTVNILLFDRYHHDAIIVITELCILKHHLKWCCYSFGATSHTIAIHQLEYESE